MAKQGDSVMRTAFAVVAACLVLGGCSHGYQAYQTEPRPHRHLHHRHLHHRHLAKPLKTLSARTSKPLGQANNRITFSQEGQNRTPSGSSTPSNGSTPTGSSTPSGSSTPTGSSTHGSLTAEFDSEREFEPEREFDPDREFDPEEEFDPERFCQSSCHRQVLCRARSGRQLRRD